MARLTGTILDEQAYARGVTQPMLDLAYGGQAGYAPDYSEWLSNSAYVRKNLICILLEAPKFFQLMPDPQKWVQALKALVELHPKTIDGFKAGLTVETDSHSFGHAGEMQDEVTDVKRDRSEPVFTFMEKYGMPIQTFIYNWITYGIMDPDTKVAMVGTLNPTLIPDDILPDWYSMSCLFIEPDAMHRYVLKSWVTTNMFPKGTGDIIGKREPTAATEPGEVTVEFTGISQFNLGTNLFAQTILDSINITNANPYLRPSFIQGIASDVAAAGVGYSVVSETLSATAVEGSTNS